MTGRAYPHGWISLPSAGELLIEHGLPFAVRVRNGKPVDVERIIADIAKISGLNVTIGYWKPTDGDSIMEAALRVDAREIDEVLRRLAQVSADVLAKRFRKPIELDDLDFDDEAYAHDFGVALGICGLRWGQADQAALRDNYVRTLRQAADAIVRQPHHE